MSTARSRAFETVPVAGARYANAGERAAVCEDVAAREAAREVREPAADIGGETSAEREAARELRESAADIGGETCSGREAAREVRGSAADIGGETCSGREAARDGSGAMFDGIARRYDLLNRLTSLGFDRAWRRAAADAMLVLPGARVLDVATGTGDLAIEIARRERSASVTGFDASPEMLAIAARKIARRGLGAQIALQLGDALALPFADGAFDRASIAFGIRNLSDRPRALSELARVLRPAGIAVILELSMPEHGLLAPLVRFHIQELVPRLGAMLSRERAYRHLERSIAAFPKPRAFAEELAAAGLIVRAIRPMTFGSVVLYVAAKGTSP